MKICYLADAKDVHTKKWVNYFAGKGHQIHLITSRFGSDRIDEGYDECVKFHLLTAPVPQRWVKSGYINTLLQYFQVLRLINRIKPDVFHAYYLIANAFLAVASGFHPIVLTALGSDVLIGPKKSHLHRFLTRYALKRAELITCDGENLKEGMIILGAEPQKIKLIYHGVDTQKYSPQQGKEFRDRLGLSEELIVISSRKLRPVYDVETLIRAIPPVMEHVPRASFIITGDGEQKEHLESLATSLGVSGNVRFLGWVPQGELQNYLASSDVYVSTSLSDSTSVSLLEAMACELPVVITRSGDNEKWVEDGKNGYIIPTGNPGKLAERIVYLLQKPNVRKEFGKLNRKIVEDKANYTKEMDKMETLYQELIRGRR